MNKVFELRELSWDTEYFGLKCARLAIIENLNTEQFSKLKGVLEGYGFVTIDNIAGSMINNKFLCSINGNYLVDVPVTYSCSLSNKDKHTSQFECTVLNNLPADEKIEMIAKKSFFHGRFYKDPLINKNLADGLYASWIKNAFYRTDKYFIIAEDKSGFVLFSEMDDGVSLDIELIAVDENERGKGIAGKMLSGLKLYAKNKGYSYINVVTQVDNINAINLYNRCGFEMARCEYTYHFWNRKNRRSILLL